MNTIIRFRLDGLWNSEFPLIIKRILVILAKYALEKMHLLVSFQRLEAFCPLLDKIEVQERNNELDKRVDETDQERDTLVSVIYAVGKDFRRAPNATISQHGEAMVNLFKKHGKDIAADNYTSETKRINDLVADAERTPAVMEALSVLASMILFDQLKDANQCFETAFMERNKYASTKETVDTKAIRKDCNQAVYALWNAIDHYVEEYGPADYEELVKEINQLTTYYKRQLKARKTRRDAKKDVSKEPPITPEGMDE